MSKPFEFLWHGQYNTEHTEYTFENTNWTALLEKVQNLTGDRNCAFDGLYHCGNRNLVRRVLLSDGESWIARVPIADYGSFEGCERSAWWTADRKFILDNEIATLKYLKINTSLPVPSIFAHQTSMESNPVKMPYVLMQCIQGNMLYDLGGPGVLTEEQKEKVRSSIASIQCQMSTIRLEKIGSLILGPGDTIEIGPLPASFGFQGPFSSPIDYYLSWAAHAEFGDTNWLKEPTDDQTLKTLKQEVECFLAGLVSALKKRPPPTSSSEGYPLIHRDFLPHNILFDEQYNIVGLPDWEKTYSAPFEVFVAETNMYSHLDSEAMQMVPNDEGGVEYMNDIMREEEKMQTPNRISSYAGNSLCAISHCMGLFDEGICTYFSRALNRYMENK
ncbi:Protein kinase-like domain protein [Venturia nashicola]|nr:Protein kinase-like domain protein [Venturia nashicola]